MACSRNKREEKCIRGLWWRARRRVTTKKPRRRYEDNVKMELRQIAWNGADRIHPAHDRDQ
jgi:hypothetical protein